MTVSCTDRDHGYDVVEADIVVETYTSAFAVLRLEGPLDALALPRLVAELDALRTIHAVVVDMSAVTFVYSAAARALDAFAGTVADARILPPLGSARRALRLLAPDLVRTDSPKKVVPASDLADRSAA